MSANRWLVTPKPLPRAALRLVCLPYAGGGASIYRTWSEILAPEIEVAIVQLPGRESRTGETPIADMRTMQAALLAEVAPALRPPYALFGHSMGALIAFELTRSLERRGLVLPSALMVSGQRGPRLPRGEKAIHTLPDAELKEEVRRLGATPDDVLRHADLMALLLPMLRADFALCETYRYEAAPPLPCPLVAFGGIADKENPRDQIEQWQNETAGAFSLRTFAGGHFFVNSARMALLQAIRAAVAAPLAA